MQFPDWRSLLLICHEKHVKWWKKEMWEEMEEKRNIHMQRTVKYAFMCPSLCSVWLQVHRGFKSSNACRVYSSLHISCNFHINPFGADVMIKSECYLEAKQMKNWGQTRSSKLHNQLKMSSCVFFGDRIKGVKYSYIYLENTTVHLLNSSFSLSPNYN